jgi:hypothetical protein
MKKLITLLIVLICCVGTVGADITIYVQNTRAWSGIYLYEWDNGKTADVAYPGTQQCVREIIDGQWYFRITITKDNFIINNNNDDQKTNDLKVSDFVNGGYYWIWGDNKGLTKMDTPSHENTYEITAQGEDITNIYMYKGNVKLAGDWPGAYVKPDNGKYYLTYKGESGDINVIFSKGNAQPQTCDLKVVQGDNQFYIASLTSSKNNDSWGEAVKTNASGYATYVTSNNLTIPTGIAFCAEDGGNGSATAHTVTNPKASTPMIISGNPSTTYHFATASTGTSLSYTNAFRAGSGSALGASDGGGVNYILKGDTFYKANGNVVATNKAYLKLSQEASARALIFPGDDDETTAIENMKATTVDSNAPIYNIAGQRVAKDYRGIVIQNGRKFINK